MAKWTAAVQLGRGRSYSIFKVQNVGVAENRVNPKFMAMSILE